MIPVLVAQFATDVAVTGVFGILLLIVVILFIVWLIRHL